MKLTTSLHIRRLHSHSHYLAGGSLNAILALTRCSAAATYLSVMKKFPSAKIVLWDTFSFCTTCQIFSDELTVIFSDNNPIAVKWARTFSNITNPEPGL